MSQRNSISIRLRSVLVGAFILIAYGVLISEVTDSPSVIMVSDVISGLAVIGIAVLMFPLFRKSGLGLSLVYLILKYAEGILMVAAGILYFFPSTRGFRDPIYENFHLYVFIVSGAIFYILLLRGKQVPGFISIWGLVGIASLSISTALSLAGRPADVLNNFLALIISNEVFLAIWLFIKDLKTTDAVAGTSEPAG